MNMFSRLGGLSADPDQGCLMLNQSVAGYAKQFFSSPLAIQESKGSFFSEIRLHKEELFQI
jgi:hypothetical protein